MKIIFAFFVCCLAVAFANPADEEMDRKRLAYLRECQGDLKLTDEDLKDQSHQGCLYACMHKKMGYLNADGTLNIEIVTSGSNNQLRIKKTQEIYQACMDKAKGDSCVLGYCLENTKLEK